MNFTYLDPFPLWIYDKNSILLKRDDGIDSLITFTDKEIEMINRYLITFSVNEIVRYDSRRKFHNKLIPRMKFYGELFSAPILVDFPNQNNIWIHAAKTGNLNIIKHVVLNCIGYFTPEVIGIASKYNNFHIVSWLSKRQFIF